MGIFQSDLTIKTAIELGFEDIRKNLWLIDDILSDAITNPYLRDKYGQKQIDACKEWLVNNQVDIYMADRKDKDRMPCITINLGSGQEKDEMKTMADQSVEKVKLLPNVIGKPIPYVVKPFTGFSYDSMSGLITIPNTVVLNGVAPGMILVDPDTGTGYAVIDVVGNGLQIEAGLDVTATRLGVVPQFQFYQARVEHTFFQETYNIACHAHGDPQTLLWLHSIVLYSILRYRESLLEAHGFTQSSLSTSDMFVNPNYGTAGGEEIFTRVITLTGMVENSWIKSPRRIIEITALKDPASDGYNGGIKILGNIDTAIQDDTTWTVIEDDEQE